ncbi:MAG: TMEM143 family protein, partial [Alphaproteobacteria bacterium]
VSMCLAEGALAGVDADAFRQAAAMVASLIHHEFHIRLETLKDAYASVAADADTRVLDPPIDRDRPPGQPGELVKALAAVLERANYEPVTRRELHAALTQESLFRVRLFVNYDDFEEVLVFKRGETLRAERVRTWFGLRKRDLTFVNYDRVLVYVRFKDAAHFQRRKRRKLLFVPGTVFIKLFQNIPRADVEMLFPNAEVRMKAADKLAIGVPALVSGAVVAATKLGATAVLIGAIIAFWVGWRKDEVKLDQAALLGLAAGLFAIGGYLWRQFTNFRNRKIQFLKLLADNLYFKKLDTNAGVFHRLIDAAEEEECKEVVLAYYFLVVADAPLEGRELDRRVEAWFRDRWKCNCDFDFDDALRKLVRLRLAVKEGTAYRAMPLDEARHRLDRYWDELFDAGHAPHESTAESASAALRPAAA